MLSRSLPACLALSLCAAFASASEPATQASDPRIVWPEGWSERKPSEAVVKQLAINATIDAGAMFASYPTSDFADGLALQDWASARIEALKRIAFNKDTTFGEARTERIADRDVVVIEDDKLVKTLKIHYEHVYFEQNGYFCSFTIWSTPSKWNTAKTAIGELLQTIQ